MQESKENIYIDFHLIYFMIQPLKKCSDQLQQLFVVAVSPTGPGNTKAPVAKTLQKVISLFLISPCI